MMEAYTKQSAISPAMFQPRAEADSLLALALSPASQVESTCVGCPCNYGRERCGTDLEAYEKSNESKDSAKGKEDNHLHDDVVGWLYIHHLLGKTDNISQPAY